MFDERTEGLRGVDERAKELGIQKFKMKLLYKRMIAEEDFPRGRIFAIDTQDQYEIAIPLLQDKHELIAFAYNMTV